MYHLTRGQVMLWSLRFEHISPSVLAALRLSLLDEERARADRFHFASDRALYTAAHALLHIMFSRYRIPATGFRVNEWGKPEIDVPGNRFCFNLTHTRGLAACAVTMVDDVGVDAESMERTVDCVALANEFFAPSEATYITALPEADRGAAFLQLWTLKEAFIKAVGRGLSVPLADFEFTLEPFSFACSPSLKQVSEDWRFESLAIGSTHRLAVAFHQPEGRLMVLSHRMFSPEELAFRPNSAE